MYATEEGEGGGVYISVLASGSKACCRVNVEVLHVGLPLFCVLGLHMLGLPRKFLQEQSSSEVS